MTVSELHIAVNLGVQKIASFQSDNLLPEEIDFELNRAQERIIKHRFVPMGNRYGRGFEQSQKRIDDLRNLVVEHTGPTTYEGEIYNSNYSPIYVDRYTFPLDYLFLISVRGDIYYECNAPITVNTTTLQFNSVEVNLTPPQDGYILVGMDRWGGSSWESIINLPLGQEIVEDQWTNSNNYFFAIFPYMTFPDEFSYAQTAHETPVQHSNRIYLTLFNSGWQLTTEGYVRLTWIPSNGTMADAVYTYNSTLRVKTKTNRYSSTGEFRRVLCTYAQHDDIIHMMDDPFNKTDYKRPLYTIEERYIDVHTNNEFVISAVRIKYIRKPVTISKSLGIGSELPDHMHQEIVDLAVKSILEGIEARRYQTQAAETLQSE
jgi:hypothetical protein